MDEAIFLFPQVSIIQFELRQHLQYWTSGVLWRITQ